MIVTWTKGRQRSYTISDRRNSLEFIGLENPNYNLFVCSDFQYLINLDDHPMSLCMIRGRYIYTIFHPLQIMREQCPCAVGSSCTLMDTDRIETMSCQNIESPKYLEMVESRDLEHIESNTLEE